MNAKHSSATNQWFTPPDYVEAARTVLGAIDFDPASCEEANAVVQALCYATTGGEQWQDWPRYMSILINPPGGVKKGRCIRENESWPAIFWDALTQYRAQGFLTHAIFIAFSLEALAVTQRYSTPMMWFPFCVPSKRIKFVSPSGKKNSPSHANAIVYLPGTIDRTDDFIRVFSALGACKR